MVAGFALGRYPITNAQYQAFIDAADGYHDAGWWDYSTAALDWRAENDEPRGIEFGDGDYPRTHITWYEAVAFCQWLSAKTGDSIRLPTESEWQRAAQGDDNRSFPWGDEWDGERCQNSLTAKHIGPTYVTEYAGQGDSPFGAVDMAGNVWEWCATKWSSGADNLEGGDVRVLRGGSWFDDVQRYFRVTTRQSWNPDIRSDLRGFRIVRA
jgi:formylglycine-generating enzyme required for sulfatase activity